MKEKVGGCLGGSVESTAFIAVGLGTVSVVVVAMFEALLILVI